LIVDDGDGGVIDKENSFGLTGVSERLLLIDAKMKITSTPAGTSVSITL
jgi:signal transduction histidine kinase